MTIVSLSMKMEMLFQKTARRIMVPKNLLIYHNYLRYKHFRSFRGLSLLLIIDKPESTGFANELGIRLAIHEQDEMAFPHENGFLIEAGYMTSIALTVVYNTYCILNSYNVNSCSIQS